MICKYSKNYRILFNLILLFFVIKSTSLLTFNIFTSCMTFLTDQFDKSKKNNVNLKVLKTTYLYNWCSILAKLQLRFSSFCASPFFSGFFNFANSSSDIVLVAKRRSARCLGVLNQKFKTIKPFQYSPSAFQSSSQKSGLETIGSNSFQLINAFKVTQIQCNTRIGQCTGRFRFVPTRNLAISPFCFKFLKLEQINLRLKFNKLHHRLALQSDRC